MRSIPKKGWIEAEVDALKRLQAETAARQKLKL